MRRVLIIGGGASGLMAAISAARQGAKVTVLERQKQVGRKLLVTGNGRCNLTNVDQEESRYRSGDPLFVENVLAQFGMHDTLKLFTELGIFTKNRKGYLYPYSDQASSVVEVLRMEAEHRKVKLALNTEIQKIEHTEEGFQVKTEGWTYEADALILACGSPASPQTGATDLGYTYAKSLGHNIICPLPALVQLYSKDSCFEKLAGLRMDGRVTLYSGREYLASDEGELQFTKKGISGIPVFQVSRFCSRALEEEKKVEAELDLLPLFSEEALSVFFKRRIEENGYKNAAQLLVGLFPAKFIDCLLERSGLVKGVRASELGEKEIQRFVKSCKSFQVAIRATGGFEEAQVCCGGVDLSQVNAETLESRVVPGLYFAGEILDVDGACGGYNLQWAWSSGVVAGASAARGQTGGDI